VVVTDRGVALSLPISVASSLEKIIAWATRPSPAGQPPSRQVGMSNRGTHPVTFRCEMTCYGETERTRHKTT
jgi:hypothetical protein